MFRQIINESINYTLEGLLTPNCSKYIQNDINLKK